MRDKRHTETVKLNGVSMDVEFYYTPADFGGNDYPSSAASYEVTAVKVGGVDIFSVLPQDVVTCDIPDLLEEIRHAN